MSLSITNSNILLSDEETDDDENPSETSDYVEIDEDSYDSDDDIENTDSELDSYLSKDKKIQWYPEPVSSVSGRALSSNVIKLTPGITRYAAKRITSDEISAFQLLFTNSIEETVIVNTNREGQLVYDNDWKPLDNVELNAYIGLLILAGVYKSNNEALENLWDNSKGRPIFRAVMSLKRFKVITRVIRFDDRNTRAIRRPTDKLAPIRELWSKWVEILPKLFNPGECVTIDEQLIGFRGKCPFRQYMPKKPNKYGIKFWVLCDSKNCYVWNIQVYTGKDIGQAPEKKQGLRVVLDLCTAALRGRNVTVDNFFASYELGQLLLKRDITMIGTIRKNKTTIPCILLDMKRRPLFTSRFCFTADTSLVSYNPKKNKVVVLQSTMHMNKYVSTDSERKPYIILDYNATKGAVDTVDKMITSYSCKRKTKRWPLVVFCNILDISVINAFVLFTNVYPDWNVMKHHRRRIFIASLGESLVKEHMARRVSPPRGLNSQLILTECNTSMQDSIPAVGRDQQKRGRCTICKKSDNKHTTKCKNCDKFICKSHTITVCMNC